VLEVYQKLCRESSGSAARLRANTITFNTLISAAGRAGDWQCALRFYADMDDCGVLPDKVRCASRRRGVGCHAPECLAARRSVRSVHSASVTASMRRPCSLNAALCRHAERCADTRPRRTHPFISRVPLYRTSPAVSHQRLPARPPAAQPFRHEAGAPAKRAGAQSCAAVTSR
jgi:pentatricopeptide repeat protein